MLVWQNDFFPLEVSELLEAAAGFWWKWRAMQSWLWRDVRIFDARDDWRETQLYGATHVSNSGRGARGGVGVGSEMADRRCTDVILASH